MSEIIVFEQDSVWRFAENYSLGAIESFSRAFGNLFYLKMEDWDCCDEVLIRLSQIAIRELQRIEVREV